MWEDFGRGREMKISHETYMKFHSGVTDAFRPLLPNHKFKSLNIDIVTLGGKEFIEINYKILPEYSEWVHINRVVNPEITPVNYESGFQVGGEMKLTLETQWGLK